MTGMKIGEYEVVRLLAKGGMGEVYEVLKPSLGSRHALKVFSYEGMDADALGRFRTEGRLLSQLNHPRIVHVRDVGEMPDGRPYFVMDLLCSSSGHPQSLADVSPGSVDEECIARWYDDIREGLEYIHGKGIVHRDLKLQNILLDAGNHAVITDFGVSRLDEAKGDVKVDVIRTLIGIKDGRTPLMGSVGYLAPELELGAPATPESDYYALGVIVYKLLTGEWCDSRTDIQSVLETFDPVWLRILPKLLHANPQARECLSFAVERVAESERQSFRLDERLRASIRRGRHARRLARGLGVAFVVSLSACLWMVGKRDSLEGRVLGAKTEVCSFDSLFAIPDSIGDEPKLDEDDEIIVPSRQQCEAAIVDAYVLTRGTFVALKRGEITRDGVIREFQALAAQTSIDAEISPFDDLTVGGEVYMRIGEDFPLNYLLNQAVDRLRSGGAE